MDTQETRIYAALLTGVVLFAILMVFFILTILRHQRRRVQAYHDLMKEEIGLMEKERTRIAKDLHDEIGVMVSAVSHLLDGMDPEKEKNIQLVGRMKSHIEETMLNIRRLSYDIMPRILATEGLQTAIQDFMDILTYSNKIKIQCTCSLLKGSITPDKEIHIFRIVQEIIQNILKHAHATVIILEMTQTGKMIQLHIQDNGVGFNKKLAAKKGEGTGLQNIMGRVTILNAKIFLTAEEQKGVDYLIKVPV